VFGSGEHARRKKYIEEQELEDEEGTKIDKEEHLVEQKKYKEYTVKSIKNTQSKW
jgi:hypothetical protein